MEYGDIPNLPLVEIKVLGRLGRKFGKVFKFYARSARDAIRCIAVNYPGFKEYLFELEKQGFRYRVYRGLNPIMDAGELLDPIAANTLIVSPIQAGAGGVFRGVGAILVGAALIGVGVLTGGTAIALAGASLFAGGIADLFSKSQPTPATETERSQSFLFDFASSGSASRLTVVPYAYGRRMRQLTREYAVSTLVETYDIAIG